MPLLQFGTELNTGTNRVLQVLIKLHQLNPIRGPVPQGGTVVPGANGRQAPKHARCCR